MAGFELRPAIKRHFGQSAGQRHRPPVKRLRRGRIRRGKNGQRRSRQLAHRPQSQVDNFYQHSRLAVAVGPTVRGVKLRHKIRRQRHCQLIRLAAIAHIQQLFQRNLANRHALGLHFSLAALRQRGNQRLKLRRGRTARPHHRLHVIFHHICGQHAKRRQRRRAGRNEHPRNVEAAGQAGGVQAAGPAKRNQRKILRVVAALDRNDPQRPLHVGIDHRNYPQRRGLGRRETGPRRQTGGIRQPGQGRLCRRHIERHLAAQKLVGGQPAQNQVGVGDGGLSPAVAVAHRAGIGPGAGRPHPQRAAGIHRRQRTAARAHGVNIDDRNPQRQPANLGLGGDLRLAHRQRHIGGSAAHVESDNLLKAGGLGHRPRPDHAAGRARQHAAHRLTPGLAGPDAAPVRLHHPEIGGAGVALKLGQIAVHHRRHKRVDHRGTGAFVLAELRQHLAGERRKKACRPQFFGDDLFVGRVYKGKEQTHRHRFNAGCLQLLNQRIELRLRQRNQRPAVVINALGDFKAQIGGHQRRGPAAKQIVNIGAILAANFQHIPKPGRGDQRRHRAFAFQQRVGRHG